LRLARPIRDNDVRVDPQILALYGEIGKSLYGVDAAVMARALKEARERGG
jgi:hypothetical protein